MGFDIIILTTTRKKSLAAELLKDFSFRTYVNEEWPLPPAEGWHPRAYDFEPKQMISYRIFRGHQECCKLVEKNTLILEDDAVPQGPWVQVTDRACGLLEAYDVVALYARAMTWIQHCFDHYDRKYVIPDKRPDWNIRWINGAVAYLVSPESAKKIAEARYTGIPYDLYLAEHLKLCAASPEGQVFDHSFQYGSTFHTPIAPIKGDINYVE